MIPPTRPIPASLAASRWAVARGPSIGSASSSTRILGRGAPRMERDLGQDRQVRAAIGGLVKALGEALSAIGLPEDLGDQGDRQLAVGSGGHSPRNSRTRFWKW